MIGRLGSPTVARRFRAARWSYALDTRAAPRACALALVAVLSGCSGGGGPAGAPAAGPDPSPASTPSTDSTHVPSSADDTRAAVERLLTHSRVESIVSNRAGPFTRRVALMADDLTDPELGRLVPAVRSAFAPDSLRRDVVRHLMAEAPGDGTVQEVLGWHETGANAELQRLADAYEPPLSLSEYARSLATTPPDRERAELMVSWARTQQAGEFYVLMEQALDEAAHTVWAELRSDAPAFTPLDGAALRSRLEESFRAAVVSFLHRFEGVPLDTVRAALAEYETEAGQWYAEAYSLAVAEAIRAAGRRAARDLGS